ncbi:MULTISPECIES: MFS transporter [unclassified Streptomyces]|uniref:MFS transporter n=1 Tax=unclassified Streptomyces TaxID=2593676 RepID=UPI002E0EF504|nr:MFS transporter [Streptomyces sp. NBC_01186]WSS42000.1 MFS transporter [Streptomyces sp. NBC_01187]
MEAPATTTDDARPDRRSPERPGYGHLLRTEGAWSFLLPGFLARQPFAMLTISIVLLVEHTSGSFGLAGAVSATAGISMALIAPQSGKLADRFGQGAVLVPQVFLHALAVGVLITVALLDAPLWVLFAATVPAGATAPQISPMVRSRWAARLRGSPLMNTAAAFESVTDEFTFVVGPVLATALCTGVHPAAGLIAEATVSLLGGLVFAAQRRTQPVPARAGLARRRGPGEDGEDLKGAKGSVAPDEAGSPASALAVPGTRVLIAAVLGIGMVFGGMQVSLTAFTESTGQPGINGVMYGVFAAGNMLAAVAVGTIRWKRGPQSRLLIAYPALVAAAALMAVASQLGPWTALLGALGMLTGLCVAPCMITCFTLIETLVPAGARTEAFTWLTGAIALGQAAGSTVAGQLADRAGAVTGFLAPFAGTGLALLVLLAFRKALRSPDSGRVAARGLGHRTAVPVD